MKFAVLTSGGDAPGMNAAIRAITRRALGLGHQVCAIHYGYKGLLEENILPLLARDVGGILEFGGTILRSSRSEDFKKPEYKKVAADILCKHNIDVVIAIGGNGSQAGLHGLALEGIRTIGVPSTIDNDLVGTDSTIGFDSAVNTSVWAIDKIRTTATSHERTFIVEVMGRDSGFLALHSGIACGADSILIPEIPVDLNKVASGVIQSRDKKKHHHVIVLAEGAGHAKWLAYEVCERTGISPYISVLGYIQRGGSPTAFDRMHASTLGVAAVEMALEGKNDCVVGIINGLLTCTPSTEVVGKLKKPSDNLMSLALQLHD
jgi:6-phosphofructokinase 1